MEERLHQFFERKAQPIIQQTQQQLLAQQVTSAYNQAQQLPYFEKYQDEIIQVAQQANPADLAHVNSWQLIHDHVAQRHMDEIISERLSQAQASAGAPPFTETGASSGPPAAQSSTGDSAELTPLEKEIAAGLGLPADVIARMKSIRGG